MAMAEAVRLPVAIIDWMDIITAIIAIAAIVICVVEEPFGDAACVCEGADELVNGDSKDVVSPNVRQSKEIVAEFLAKEGDPEPKFAEPDQ